MDELAREMRDVKQRLASVESLCQRTLQAAEQVAHLLQQQQYQVRVRALGPGTREGDGARWDFLDARSGGFLSHTLSHREVRPLVSPHRLSSPKPCYFLYDPLPKLPFMASIDFLSHTCWTTL